MYLRHGFYSLVDLYDNFFIDEFDLHFNSEKAFVKIYSKSYPINFVEIFESSLYRNGFNTWSDDLISLFEFEDEMNKYYELKDWKDAINEFLYNDSFSIYDFINIEMM